MAFAREKKVDLLVLGSRGMGSVKRWAFVVVVVSAACCSRDPFFGEGMLQRPTRHGWVGPPLVCTTCVTQFGIFFG